MSNLAVIEAEIIDVLPYQERTPSNIAWVRENLANRDNSPSDVLAACKEFFGVTDARISQCESRLDSLGVQLNSHIFDTARNFETVNQRLNKLESQAETAKAVADNDRFHQQSFNKSFNDGLIGANQNATNAAGSKGWGYHPDHTGIFFLFLFVGSIGCFLFSSMNLNNRPASVQSAPQQPIIRGY
jgi:hypothetical protein